MFDHWTAVATGIVTTASGIVWLLVRFFYNWKQLNRVDSLADAQADVQIARAQVEAIQIRRGSQPDVGSGKGGSSDEDQTPNVWKRESKP
jgi:hypothetical protein